MTTVADCIKIDLPGIQDRRGSLTHVYNRKHIPFDIVRTYYLYDVPTGQSHGSHAHRQLQQLIVSVAGAFDVTLDDGSSKKTVRLKEACSGLYIPSMIWRELVNFSPGGICLVLASLCYDESEYIRDYNEFLQLKQAP